MEITVTVQTYADLTSWGKLNIQEKTKKKKKDERGKHDQKASNDIADWKWEKRRVTTRRVATT